MKPSREQRALVAVMSAAARLRRQAAGIVDTEGLSSSQYNVLRILRGAGDALPTMEIRERMMDREPSITRLLDRLVERGLVVRTPSEKDRRRVDCHITAAGLELLERLDGPVDAMDRRLMRGFSPSELDALSVLMDRVAPE